MLLVSSSGKDVMRFQLILERFKPLRVKGVSYPDILRETALTIIQV